MKLKSFARAGAFAFAALLLPSLVVAPPALAQEENAPTVVDAVIAQVNNDVITLSMLRREMARAVDTLKQQRGMTEQQAQDEVTKNQSRILANLVNERLIMQKGDEIPRLKEDVEADVNREMLRVANAQGIKTIEALDQALRESGLDPADIRQTLRAQFTRQAVYAREVDAKIYYGLTDKELKEFFDKNRDRFRKPESVELSEIFLSIAGRPEAEVKAKATELVSQLRGGADFGSLAVSNSEREQNGQRVASDNKGKVGRFEIDDLKPEFVATLKDIKVGGVTDPIKLDDGYQIIRVDARTPGGDPTFTEERVRGAITQDRVEKERETYLQNLRKEAYIKVAKDYEADILPLLKIEVQKTASTESDDAPKKKP